MTISNEISAGQWPRVGSVSSYLSVECRRNNCSWMKGGCLCDVNLRRATCSMMHNCIQYLHENHAMVLLYCIQVEASHVEDFIMQTLGLKCSRCIEQRFTTSGNMDDEVLSRYSPPLTRREFLRCVPWFLRQRILYTKQYLLDRDFQINSLMWLKQPEI